MSLQEWHKNGWLKPHKTSPEEISNLLAIVERDREDANQNDISADWRFGIAYNAALKLCTILLYARGFRPDKNMAHFRTLQALPLILGKDWAEEAVYLDTCRIKRNTVEYDYVGGVTGSEAGELLIFVNELNMEVISWLKKEYPSLLRKQPITPVLGTLPPK